MLPVNEIEKKAPKTPKKRDFIRKNRQESIKIPVSVRFVFSRPVFHSLFVRKYSLAKSDALRGKLDEFVVGDEFHALFEAELCGRD